MVQPGPHQVALNAAPKFLLALIPKVCELMGGTWEYDATCDTFAAVPGDIEFVLASPYHRKRAEYELSKAPRINIGMGRMIIDTEDPRGLNDLVTHFEFTVEVAQRLADPDLTGYSQVTMWRIWDIADYLAGRLNRARLTAEQIGVADIVNVQPNITVAQEREDHYAVTITGRTRLEVDAQRDLMTTEQFYSDFERVAIDDPNAPAITSVGVEVIPIDQGGRPLNVADREALRRMERF